MWLLNKETKVDIDLVLQHTLYAVRKRKKWNKEREILNNRVIWIY